MSPENPELAEKLRKQAEAEAAKKSPATPEHVITPVEELSPEEKALADYWMAQIEAEPPKKSPEEAEKEQALVELNALFDLWLVEKKLGPLNAITTKSEALADPLRIEGKLAAGEMFKRVKLLGSTPELVEKYRTFAKALGVINGDTVDHTRW